VVEVSVRSGVGVWSSLEVEVLSCASGSDSSVPGSSSDAAHFRPKPMLTPPKSRK
jgi:hypothetical protein